MVGWFPPSICLPLLFQQLNIKMQQPPGTRIQYRDAQCPPVPASGALGARSETLELYHLPPGPINTKRVYFDRLSLCLACQLTVLLTARLVCFFETNHL